MTKTKEIPKRNLKFLHMRNEIKRLKAIKTPVITLSIKTQTQSQIKTKIGTSTIQRDLKNKLKEVEKKLVEEHLKNEILKKEKEAKEKEAKRLASERFNEKCATIKKGLELLSSDIDFIKSKINEFNRVRRSDRNFRQYKSSLIRDNNGVIDIYNKLNRRIKSNETFTERILDNMLNKIKAQFVIIDNLKSRTNKLPPINPDPTCSIQ